MEDKISPRRRGDTEQNEGTIFLIPKIHMTRKRIFVSVLFFVVACAILAWFSYGSYFCVAERTGRSHALTTARLAFAFTAWNLFSGWCVSLLLTLGKKRPFQCARDGCFVLKHGDCRCWLRICTFLELPRIRDILARKYVSGCKLLLY